MEIWRIGRWRLILTMGYMLLILTTSLIPMDREVESLRFITELKPLIQNLLHIPAFAILSILWLGLISTYQIDEPKKIVLVLFLATGFGMLNELIQIAIPGRYAGITDLCLNTIGVLMGVLIYSLLERAEAGFFRRIICG